MPAATDRVSFLGRTVPEPFQLRVVPLPAGARRPYDEEEWLGAIVVIELGAVELECTRGGRRRFSTGAVLWLAGLPLVAIHNPDPNLALLVAVARRGALYFQTR